MDADLRWIRCGDSLPGMCEPVLTAKWDAMDGIWRVYDGRLYVRHEGVVPSIMDLEGGKLATDWWFDCIYPGKGNMRLGHEDLLWTPLPVPEQPRHKG